LSELSESISRITNHLGYASGNAKKKEKGSFWVGDKSPTWLERGGYYGEKMKQGNSMVRLELCISSKLPKWRAGGDTKG